MGGREIKAAHVGYLFGLVHLTSKSPGTKGVPKKLDRPVLFYKTWSHFQSLIKCECDVHSIFSKL